MHFMLLTLIFLMGAGTAFMIVVPTGGLIRNLALFPITRRKPG